MAIEFTDMTDQQMADFLAEPRHAAVATTRKDGSPQLSAVWFVYRDGKIFFDIYNRSAKYFNIRRDPRVAVLVDAGCPDARTVTLYGHAELIEEPSSFRDELEWAIARQYHDSEEEAVKYMETAVGPPSSMVVVTPYRILGQDYN